MKVICKEVDPERFPVSEEHRAHFRRYFGRGVQNKVYKELRVGAEYQVYGLTISRGYTSYLVACDRAPSPWKYRPSLCFEVVDARPSRQWRFYERIHRAPSGAETLSPRSQSRL